MATSVEDVERLLIGDPHLPCEACRRMRGGYRSVLDQTLPPTRITLERITAKCVELYRVVTSLG